jgi:hypothetical protein
LNVESVRIWTGRTGKTGKGKVRTWF